MLKYATYKKVKRWKSSQRSDNFGEKKVKAWGLTEAELQEPDIIWAKLEQTCGIDHSFRAARLEFSNMKQTSTIDSFYTDLKAQCDKCRFKDPEERLIDQMIKGISNTEAKKELVVETESLTLANCIKIAKKHEALDAQFFAFQSVNNPNSTAVNLVKNKPMYKNCYFCGQDHPKGECPAHGYVCKRCKEKHHWTSQCERATEFLLRKQKKRGQFKPSKDKKTKDKKQSKAKSRHDSKKTFQCTKSEDSEDGDDPILKIQNVNINMNLKSTTEQLNATVEVKKPKANLTVQVDTGAEANLLPLRCFKQMFPEHTSDDGKPVPCEIVNVKPFTKLSAYNSSEIKHYGAVKLLCKHASTKSWNNTDFYICESSGPIILGLKDSLQLGLISVHNKVYAVNQDNSPIKDTKDLTTKYPDRFKGLGKFPGKVRIELKDDAQPVVHAPRRCPIHLKGEIQKALEQMESQDIIEKIPQGQPTEWLSSLAYA